jgi:hypothetical protein
MLSSPHFEPRTVITPDDTLFFKDIGGRIAQQSLAHYEVGRPRMPGFPSPATHAALRRARR